VQDSNPLKNTVAYQCLLKLKNNSDNILMMSSSPLWIRIQPMPVIGALVMMTVIAGGKI
jgi:hypothetical protein